MCVKQNTEIEDIFSFLNPLQKYCHALLELLGHCVNVLRFEFAVHDQVVRRGQQFLHICDRILFFLKKPD